MKNFVVAVIALALVVYGGYYILYTVTQEQKQYVDQGTSIVQRVELILSDGVTLMTKYLPSLTPPPVQHVSNQPAS